jgi:hypothetical protein
MVEIINPDLNQVLEHFEEMIAAIERYRAELLKRRERYEKEARDPKTYRPIASNLLRLDRLQQELEGDIYDLLQQALDGSGVLASVDEGRWI